MTTQSDPNVQSIYCIIFGCNPKREIGEKERKHSSVYLTAASKEQFELLVGLHNEGVHALQMRRLVAKS